MNLIKKNHIKNRKILSSLLHVLIVHFTTETANVHWLNRLIKLNQADHLKR